MPRTTLNFSKVTQTLRMSTESNKGPYQCIMGLYTVTRSKYKFNSGTSSPPSNRNIKSKLSDSERSTHTQGTIHI